MIPFLAGTALTVLWLLLADVSIQLTARVELLPQLPLVTVLALGGGYLFSRIGLGTPKGRRVLAVALFVAALPAWAVPLAKLTGVDHVTAGLFGAGLAIAGVALGLASRRYPALLLIGILALWEPLNLQVGGVLEREDYSQAVHYDAVRRRLDVTLGIRRTALERADALEAQIAELRAALPPGGCQNPSCEELADPIEQAVLAEVLPDPDGWLYHRFLHRAREELAASVRLRREIAELEKKRPDLDCLWRRRSLLIRCARARSGSPSPPSSAGAKGSSRPRPH